MSKNYIKIERFKENPLLVPNSTIKWMSKNVFNCGVTIDDGVWKMLVRGAHTDSQTKSDLGLALSTDGIYWNLLVDSVLKSGFNRYCTRGIEDARIVKWIDGWHYIFATVCSVAGGRVGIWKTKNFLNYVWVGLPFDQEGKNASIFPETIGGWAYLLHRKVQGHIWISRTRDLSLKNGWQDSQILINKNKFYCHPEHGVMPTKIGIAGPPIRTKKGYFVVTHVVHRYAPNVNAQMAEYQTKQVAEVRASLLYRAYSLSFMVLDLNDPTKVIYTHPEAILYPEERYEVAGAIPNVVFSCATVDPGGDSLYIYWGGADTVVCGGRLRKKDLPMCY